MLVVGVSPILLNRLRILVDKQSCYGVDDQCFVGGFRIGIGSVSAVSTTTQCQ
ncbi:hypothetical protein [Saccharospirillum sp. MSK14-1]|uniref:hypothetical protein n=1 Tax=Saccharospirillum sp. MSK14-1 TaxID=1897632 RepID=UPI0018EE55BF|nr:hypothetical protein [Saccharospirillum sp. MSK14-1]